MAKKNWVANLMHLILFSVIQMFSHPHSVFLLNQS